MRHLLSIDDLDRDAIERILARAASFVRHLLSSRLTLRRSPEVQFLFDQSVAAQDRVEQILQDLKREEAERQPAGDGPAPGESAKTDADE